MKLACASLIFACSLLLSVQLSAQEGMRTCQYDLECGPASSCNTEGRCVPHGRVAVDEEGADDACGRDRRCRIDRLKRKNKAERHKQTIEEERQVRDILEQEEKERLKDFPRLKDPLSGDIRVSRLGALGLHAGYVLGGHFQPEIEFAYLSRYVFVPAQGEFVGGLDGNLDVWFFRFGVTYFLLEGWFSPYLSAGFQLGTGSFETYTSDVIGGDFFESTGLQTKFHAGEIGGGVDLQLVFGMHTRLGLAYRPLIYNQARYGPGSYDPLTKEGLSLWFKEAASVDVIWLIGWAI